MIVEVGKSEQEIEKMKEFKVFLRRLGTGILPPNVEGNITLPDKMVESDFESVFNNPNSQKSDIVTIIKKYVPDFMHIETGKHLDQKM